MEHPWQFTKMWQYFDYDTDSGKAVQPVGCQSNRGSQLQSCIPLVSGTESGRSASGSEPSGKVQDAAPQGHFPGRDSFRDRPAVRGQGDHQGNDAGGRRHTYGGQLQEADFINAILLCDKRLTFPFFEIQSDNLSFLLC